MKRRGGDLLEGLSVAAACSPEAFLLPLWAGLVRGTATFEDFLAAVRARRQLTFLTIDTTGACDLKCSEMCYYNPRIRLSNPFVSESRLVDAIRQAADNLSLHVLAFAGKEPFLNPTRLFSLIHEAGSLTARDFATGIVTNGRHVVTHAARLQEASAAGHLDYVDISIDTANALEHDDFRGLTGTHQRAIQAVQWLNTEAPNVRTTVVSVLRWNNGQGILDLLRNLSPLNSFYQIQPIQPPPYSSIPPLTAEHVVRFLSALEGLLGGPLSGAEISVSIELLGIYLLEAAQAGFLRWDQIREDQNCNLYVQREIGKNTLTITCEVFPLQAWRLARITYSGAYLAHMHFLQAPDPDAFATGHLNNDSIVALFERSMASDSYLAKIVSSRAYHECRGRPCWANCFGGWNGAENSLLENRRKLSDQPRLCTKGEEDLKRLEALKHDELISPPSA
jgi:MoaA/NifB/PqqE/SkfB family radical SAM enzyme